MDVRALCLALLAALLVGLALAGCDKKPAGANVPSAADILAAPDATPKVNPAHVSFLASLDLLCKLTKDAKAMTDRSEADRARHIAETFMGSKPDPELMKIMQSLAVSDPASRTPTLRAEAARRGRKNWSCPSLEEP